jgi:tRNA(Glu) U13 pseudouridine synthase TruD
VTIRRTPNDFRVEERQTAEFHASIAADRTPSHPFAAYTLEKISLATPDALTFIARALKIPREAVAAAGLKDRHAVTVQVITIDAAAFRGRSPERYETESWRLTRLGFVPRAADATIIARNAFTIVVRSLDKRSADELVRRASLVRDDEGGLLFVNYFGDRQGLRGESTCARRVRVGTSSCDWYTRAQRFRRRSCTLARARNALGRMEDCAHKDPKDPRARCNRNACARRKLHGRFRSAAAIHAGNLH